MDIKSPVAEARNEYTYSAGGTKLRVAQRWNPNYNITPNVGFGISLSSQTDTMTTDYAGNMIYENGNLKRILVEGGYIEGNTYHFYLTDHLGNNRVVAKADGTVVQRNHYYPFGMAFAETPVAEQGKQPYKYNGKEFDSMHGLNLYDYSARQMEATLGRFTSIDPHAEKYYNISPYVYAANNPIKIIDPTGMDTTHVDLQGNVQLNLQGGENMFVVDEELLPVTVEGEQFERLEYMGLSYNGTACVGMGYSASLNLGYIPNDGLFLNLTFAVAWGFDISHGVTGTVGNYVGDDKPTGASLTGSSWNVNGGMGGVSFGTSSDIVQYNPVEIGKTGSYKYDEKIGTNWNMRSEGYSFGSKSFISGTAQRAYTTPPLFLYKTSK